MCMVSRGATSNTSRACLEEEKAVICSRGNFPLHGSIQSTCHSQNRLKWSVGLVSRQWRTAFLSYPPILASLKLSEIVNPETRSESYAIEINRRLALYLERSGGSPLTLDIFLWSDHNKSFAMMALEMLSACAQRTSMEDCVGNPLCNANC
ncbi:hypothetical protein M378DRAFT_812055 [Amanita muscaria Koide BX008]|uniref:Uncharacterized protein n=1 Tax=Amanita muscaria (strain Koide BX008) TaxID=946122 RepID=A0A0C2WZL0_AMAMK|nr:hypothetical protein M378DRAFT_812055 [Amanita muscaria Koide BX008]